jgi:hypothetical protein
MSMNIPRFTAEISLARTTRQYCSAVSGVLSDPSVGTVTSQALVETRGWVGWCPAPFCGRDEWGRCHCYTVQAPPTQVA